MKLKFIKWIPAAIALFLAAMAATGRGQGPIAVHVGPPDADGNMIYRSNMDRNMVQFIGTEAILGDRLVTGSPFSADTSREFTQTLSDGTKIDRRTIGSIARDSQGRTRREMTPPAIGPFASSGAPTIVLINDPVAHKQFALNPKDKSARELGPAPRWINREGSDGIDGPGIFIKRGTEELGPAGAPGGLGDEGPVQYQVKIKTGPDGAGKLTGGEPVTVSLGTKTIEGVTVNGTRTTSTIPVGAIGNEKAIEIVFERWYSPDLLTDVMTRRSDPFSGESVFALTNIKREEPAASLFQVPSDYKMEAGHPGMRMDGMFGPDGLRKVPHAHGQSGGQNAPGAPDTNQNPPPAAAPLPPVQGQGQSN